MVEHSIPHRLNSKSPTDVPQLWVLAGGNGAGKSTFYERFLKPSGLPFVNADILARELFPDDPEANSYEAARAVEVLRQQLVEEGRTFCFETVFSHPSKIDFVAMARARGYEIILVYIHLELAALNVARVSQRVGEGGHSVPEDKIASRIPRTMENVRTALPLCDRCRFVDNSDARQPMQFVADYRDGAIELLQDPAPTWLGFLLRPE